MTNGNGKIYGMSLPVFGMVMMAICGAIIVSASFAVISHWPLPVSVVPYFGPSEGFFWGLVVGAVNGLVIGFLVDDKHFS